MLRSLCGLAMLLGLMTYQPPEVPPKKSDNNTTVKVGKGVNAQVVTLVPRDSLRRKVQAKYTMTVPGWPAIKNVGLPTPPDTVDWSKGKNGPNTYPILGNDRYGDCYYACIAHASQTWTGCVQTESSFDTNALISRYLTISGGDNGLDTTTAMAEFTAGIIGPKGPHKILANMDISPTDTKQMALAIHLFGGVAFTLGIPDIWLQNVQPGQVWDGGPGVFADMRNGHAVYLTGKNSRGYDVQTWGLNPPIVITPAGVGSCAPEAVAMFSLEWFDPSTGKAPNGYTYDELAGFWTALGGGPLPPNPFPPVPPGPGPGPTPTPTPVQWPTYDITLAGTTPWGKVNLKGSAVPRAPGAPAPKED